MSNTVYILAPVCQENDYVIELVKRVFKEIENRISITRKKHPKDITSANFEEQGQFFGQQYYILETTYQEYLQFATRNLTIISPIIYIDDLQDGSHIKEMKKIFY